MNNQITNIIQKAQLAFKKQDYIKSYSLYKSIYRKFNLLNVIPNLVDIAFISVKKNLLVDRDLKYKLINNLINFGLSRDNNTALTNQLYYLKLKVLREFKKFPEFNQTYQNISKEMQNIVFIQFEYLHFLLEKEKYEEAEKVLKKINSAKSNFYKNLKIFNFDKQFFEKIINDKNDLKHDIIHYEEQIVSDYNYVVVVSGDYRIFVKEMINFIESLKKSSTKFLLSVLIHDAQQNEIETICDFMSSLKLDNYRIDFENSKCLKLGEIETKSYYTARRYILVNDMMEKYSKPIFLFDADSIIRKNLNEYLDINSQVDMSLYIKDEIRYFNLIITANQAMFNLTSNSKIFLNFYKKYIFYLLNNKKLIWHVDQIVLYIAFIITQRFFKAKIHNNGNNNHKNKDCFFYHSFHNKYLL